jgi:hypothetical protein
MPALSPSPLPCAPPSVSTVHAINRSAVPPTPIPINPPCGAPLAVISNEHFEGAVLIKMRGAGGGENVGSCSACPCAGPRSWAGGEVQGGGGCEGGGDGCVTPSHCVCPSSYFSQRPSVMFEVSIEGRFLAPTRHLLYMGAELIADTSASSPSSPPPPAAPFTLQLSWVKRSLIKVIANLISSFFPNVKWTLGDPVSPLHPSTYLQSMPPPLAQPHRLTVIVPSLCPVHR